MHSFQNLYKKGSYSERYNSIVALVALFVNQLLHDSK